MNENRFRYIWKLLCKTYQENGHCLISGCGKETLYWWVLDTCHESIPQKELRHALIVAHSRGWVVRKKSLCNYSIFLLNCGLPNKAWSRHLESVRDLPSIPYQSEGDSPA